MHRAGHLEKAGYACTGEGKTHGTATASSPPHLLIGCHYFSRVQECSITRVPAYFQPAVRYVHAAYTQVPHETTPNQ